MNRWGNKYAGFLINSKPINLDNPSYFTYYPTWDGQYSGCNVVFDMGIALGEFIIANCPRLHWELDSISARCPHEANILRKDFGSGFQRPVLTGCRNPTWYLSPFTDVRDFVSQVTIYTTRPDMMTSLRRMQRGMRSILLDQLVNKYLSSMKDYSYHNSQDFLDREFLENYIRQTEAEAEEAEKDYE